MKLNSSPKYQLIIRYKHTSCINKQPGVFFNHFPVKFVMVRRAHEQKITVQTIAKIVNLDVSMVNKILNNEDIDIPLHLLSDT